MLKMLKIKEKYEFSKQDREKVSQICENSLKSQFFCFLAVLLLRVFDDEIKAHQNSSVKTSHPNAQFHLSTCFQPSFTLLLNREFLGLGVR